MSKNYNRVAITGNLTRDPEVRQTQSGTYVTTFGVAVNERVPDGAGGFREEASFFDVTFFGKRAESAGRHLAKGRSVLIEGKLRQSRWKDKETGAGRSKVEIVGDDWLFLGGDRPQQDGPPPQQRPQGGGGWEQTKPGGQTDYSDLPF